MSTSRVKTTRHPATGKAKPGKPAKNTVRRKKRAAVRKKQQSSQAQTTKRPPAARRKQARNEFPNWRDLATSNERAPGRSRLATHIDNVSTVRFGLLLLAVAAVFTFYIGHVYATQDVLIELQQARRANLQLHLKRNQLKGDFDRATGPSVVYQRARAAGLEEGIEYGPTIEIE